MARPNVADADLATSISVGALTAASGAGSTTLGVNNQVAAFYPGLINVSVSGSFTATIVIEKSYDGGATWLPVQTDLAGTALSFTGSGTFNREIQIEEGESGVCYRGRCTAFTSGTANVRISQG